jgi:hypothetical protein
VKSSFVSELFVANIGHIPDENQVSKTSLSLTHSLPFGASVPTYILLLFLLNQAGI